MWGRRGGRCHPPCRRSSRAALRMARDCRSAAQPARVPDGVLDRGGGDPRRRQRRAAVPSDAESAGPRSHRLADGAAYDPRSDTWRAIADAPVRFSWSSRSSSARPRTSGSPASRGGRRRRAPFSPTESARTAGRSSSMPTDPACSTSCRGWRPHRRGIHSDEEEQRPDLVYDPSSSEGASCRPTRSRPGFDRSPSGRGEELLLFDHELTEDLSGDLPLRAAASTSSPAPGTSSRTPTRPGRRRAPARASSGAARTPKRPRAGPRGRGGDDRFVFLGSSWPEDQGWSEGKLVARAWLWLPPPEPRSPLLHHSATVVPPPREQPPRAQSK